MLSTRLWLQINSLKKLLQPRNYGIIGSQSIPSKSYYNFIDAEKFRKQFSKYSGGSVDLKKNDDTGIAMLMLNNPEKKNCLTGQMIVELESKICELENWTAGKALILHGSANTFCSGFDLNTAKKVGNPDDGSRLCLWMQDTLLHLYRLPLISVALVEGKALGGGAELCTACDFRLMTKDAVIQFVHVMMGLVPGFGGGSQLTNLVGSTNALHYLASAKPILAQEALNVGLINAIIPCGPEAMTATYDWLKCYLKGAPEVIQALKNIIAHSRTLSLVDSLHKERQQFVKVWGKPANLAAISKNIKHN